MKKWRQERISLVTVNQSNIKQKRLCVCIRQRHTRTIIVVFVTTLMHIKFTFKEEKLKILNSLTRMEIDEHTKKHQGRVYQGKKKKSLPIAICLLGSRFAVQKAQSPLYKRIFFLLNLCPA